MASLTNVAGSALPDDFSRRAFFRQHQQLAHPRAPATNVYLLRRGWAVRFKLMTDGRRQITAFYVPGDLCGLDWLCGGQAIHPVQAVVDIDAFELPCNTLLNIAYADKRIFRQLTYELALRSAIEAELGVSLGRRTAAERLAHLFCEMRHRINDIENASSSEFQMPLTQLDLADLTGLTSIHVNRVLQQMRGANLIELKNRRLKIIDYDRLERLALFDGRYLATSKERRLKDTIMQQLATVHETTDCRALEAA